ncbi:unnamed protein product, partial [Meganyctiphanes norvegica]
VNNMAEAQTIAMSNSSQFSSYRHGELRDVVSVVLWSEDETKGDPYVVMCSSGGVVGLPRREVTHQDEGLTWAHRNQQADEHRPPWPWPGDVSWSYMSLKVSQSILGCNDNDLNIPILLHMSRIYVPSQSSHYTHAILGVNVPNQVMSESTVKKGHEKKRLSQVLNSGCHKVERRIVFDSLKLLQSSLACAGEERLALACITEVGPHQVWRNVASHHMTSYDLLIRSP